MQPQNHRHRWDMVIRGGTVVDGTGAPPFAADVAISGDRISAVSQQIDGEARITLDAGGCLVCPGFIDAHSHSDTYLLLEPLSPSKVMQGITTEIIGQCGASAAPLLGRARLPGDWRRFTYPGKWRTFADYRRLLEDVGPAVNVRAFVGHNTLRGCVTGYDPRPADSGELARMRRLLAEAMDQGAAGLSSGLAYPPGRYAAVEELIELNR
ncbi:MAG TPA: D-aminoacylase, partial [Lentisphaerae bacterium]|nr:D-aminoacylase [Lentisphaerota bacterium]